jgi:glucose-1-phosphate cytidylyltransferase
MMNATVIMDLPRGRLDIENGGTEPWRVVLADTGDETMTGGRLKRVAKYLSDETFCLTYGDGVSNVDVSESIEFHKQQGKFCTMTAVQPPGRWGVFSLHENDPVVQHFREKPQGDDAWVNGGFFVCEPQVLDYIEGDTTVWEREPMTNLARDNQMVAYRHSGFWQPMDTLRDKNVLEELWASGKAPWKIW